MLQRKVKDYVSGTDPVFDKAIPLLLKSEGGYVCHPKDPGGATNLGITIGTARQLNLDENGDGVVDVLDIKQLRKDTATAVYYQEYWLKAHCNEMPGKLAYLAFDASVNHGWKQAIKLMQQALGVTPDGDFGKVSRAAAISAKQAAVVAKFRDVRGNFYQRLIAQNPDLLAFRDGWLSRNRKVCEQAALLF